MEATEGEVQMFKLREHVDLRVDQVLSAHALSEAKEEELKATPRWRFRRRRHLERSLQRRQAWEETLREGLVSSAKSDAR